MSISQSSASSSSLSSGASSGDKILVQGETAPSVNVQSQLATSTINEGAALSSSNLSQVVGDLSKAHSAHAGWIESESAKISEWGQREVERVLAATKAAEQRIVATAQERQKALDEEHKVELAKLIQRLDADKAKRLKELEDQMQRDLQASLNSSKSEIADIESKMNTRKMELLSMSQAQTAKDVDKLSALAVTAKLQPSVTRTVIDTNVETGTVIAVAAGGEISTGAAAAQTVATKRVEAVPTAGTLAQEADVKTGEIRRNVDDARVGHGAIVNTMTEVVQQPHMADPVGGINQGVASHSTISQSGGSIDSGRVGNDYAGAGTATGVSGVSGVSGAPSTHSSTTATTGATTHSNPLLGNGGSGDSAVSGYTGGVNRKIDAAYGVPMAKTSAVSDHTSSGKHDADDASAHGKHSSGGGLLNKMKAAITGEPKSSDSHSRRV